jgi:dynein heavy chain
LWFYLQDVEAARQEASENVKFLKPLRRFLEKINTMDDFVALADQFKPLLHVMLLIWKHSSSYSSSARFATLLREVCNDLIMQVGGLIADGEHSRSAATAAQQQYSTGSRFCEAASSIIVWPTVAFAIAAWHMCGGRPSLHLTCSAC